MIKKQFTLYVENRPGLLAKVTSRLAAKDVNLQGISATTSTDVGLIQIVASNAAATKRVLKEIQVPYTVQDVAVLPLENRPGALAEAAAKLAKGGVNINYIYATACSCSGRCDCCCDAIISAPDLKRLEQVWSSI